LFTYLLTYSFDVLLVEVTVQQSITCNQNGTGFRSAQREEQFLDTNKDNTSSTGHSCIQNCIEQQKRGMDSNASTLIEYHLGQHNPPPNLKVHHLRVAAQLHKNFTSAAKQGNNRNRQINTTQLNTDGSVQQDSNSTTDPLYHCSIE
jgi:hypothetical protein